MTELGVASLVAILLWFLFGPDLLRWRRERYERRRKGFRVVS